MPIISRNLRDKIASLFNEVTSKSQWHKNMHAIEVDRYLKENLFSNPKYLDNNKLNRYERQSFSQFGEDGIISEIFRRIGVTNKFFIEFGVENGLECNTTNLLLQQWEGLWIDGSEKFYKEIQGTFAKEISANQLAVLNRFITADNIESLFAEGRVPMEPDLLSIDIDFNDFYIWEAIKQYRPRVVILEYNAVIMPEIAWTVEYNENAVSSVTSHFGASLRAYELLGRQKGYCLVGCTFAGVNSFFVREDCVGNFFEPPFTAANHYEPPRYFLYTKNGHLRGWGAHKILS